MLQRLSRFLLSQSKQHHTHEILSKMSHIKAEIHTEQTQLSSLKNQLKQKESQTQNRNKQIHKKRIKLTQDNTNLQQFWINAKKQCQKNKAIGVQHFAMNLISLGEHFNKTKEIEKQQHSVDIKEGFDNTARLFFNTLEKFNIKRTQIQKGVKIRAKDQFQVVEKEKAEKDQFKDTVKQVVEQGWVAQGKTIVKAKVVLYQ